MKQIVTSNNRVSRSSTQAACVMSNESTCEQKATHTVHTVHTYYMQILLEQHFSSLSRQFKCCDGARFKHLRRSATASSYLLLRKVSSAVEAI
jgi:hypothetical protein